jgi:hypothetical protein
MLLREGSASTIIVVATTLSDSDVKLTYPISIVAVAGLKRLAASRRSCAANEAFQECVTTLLAEPLDAQNGTCAPCENFTL